jgi:hypothetical protein
MARSPDLQRLVRAFEDAVQAGADQTVAFLASPAGRRLRSLTARGLVLATPLVLRHPFFRTPLGRLVQVGGAAALVAKAASMLRDWEPAPLAVRQAVRGSTLRPSTATDA